MTKILVFATLLTCGVLLLQTKNVAGHGRLIDPPSRSSVWRHNAFTSFDPPINYNDMELFCGGRDVQISNGGRCGECGDPYTQPRPRDNEEGGIFYRGIITAHYRPSEEITVKVDLTANHLGYFEFRVCAKNSAQELIQQDCLDQNVLQLVDGSGTKFQINGGQLGITEIRLRLPPGLTCNFCVLQWHYYTANFMGDCADGSQQLGCGPQETFRGCADISIN